MTGSVPDADPLLAWRGEFPILDRTTYLISNSLGAVPRGTGAALLEYHETWASRGVRAWEEGWWTLAADLGDAVAPLMGAQSGEVVFQPNVTLAHAVLLSAMDWNGPRRRVVTDALHFPSILYLLEGLDAEVEVVPSDDGLTIDTQRVVEAIDDRTAAVCVSHVLFKSSMIHDVAAIAHQARASGACTIVDGYQAVGSIPVDVRALGVDAYIGGCLKWLCGGPGAAFLWVDPDRRGSWRPRLTGWMAHRRPFAFEPTLERREDAWRFLHGTPAIPAMYAAREGLRILRVIGSEAIRSKSLRQTRRLIELADAAGYEITSLREPDRRGGTVCVQVPRALAVSRALKAREVLCDYRPGAGIRLAPHFYTRDAELELAMAAIGQILETGQWRAFEAADSAVT
jgi:kynureninase